MFEDVKIPQKIDSPIQEAVLEVRYEGQYPAEALYGLLFEVFDNFPHKEDHALPLFQVPSQIRAIDPNFKYQPYYHAIDGGFSFALGPHSIVFHAFQPYSGWSEWKHFFSPILQTIKEKQIVISVERIGFRTFDIFDDNIFDKINACFFVGEKTINTRPTSFFTEFDQGEVHVLLNLGNAVNVNGQPGKKSLIDIDCIYQFGCSAEQFFASYEGALEKAHLANKQVFFGLIKQDLLSSLNPEF